MSLKAVWDTRIQLYSIRNTAITTPSVWILVLKLYQLKNGEKIYSKPYKCGKAEAYYSESSFSEEEESEQKEDLAYKKPWINNQHKYFQTSLFTMRTVIGDLQLNEYITFRSEIEIPKGFFSSELNTKELLEMTQDPLYISVQLYSK